MIIKSTYECEICHAVNAAVHFHCAYCGTVPARYSITGKPIRLQSDDSIENGINFAIPVVVAYGVERAEMRRNVKHNLVTVRHDYYAEPDHEPDKIEQRRKFSLDKPAKL